MPYDPFAAALGDDTDLEDATTCGSNGVARSLDAANAHDIIVLDDLTEAPLSGTDVGATKSAATNNTNIAAKENIRKRQRMSAEATTAVRRKFDASKSLNLTPIPEKDGSNIKTVFVPVKNSFLALPLWPQFVAAWRGANFGKRTWVVLSSQSKWFSQMILTAIPKAKRETVTSMFHLAKNEFSLSLSKQRSVVRNLKSTAGNVDRLLAEDGDDSSESSDDGEDRFKHRVSDDTQSMVHLTIGEHTVECMNTQKQIVLSVNDDTVAFIRHWLLPLALKYATDVRPIMNMVRTKSQSSFEQTDSQTSEESKAKNLVPKWQHKVIWCPSKMAWLVKAKNVAKNIKHVKEFPVDTALRGTDFCQVRASQFRLAVAEWNNSDGSKPERIELAEGFADMEAQPMQTIMDDSDQMESTGTESGSQPSPIAHRWEMDAGL
jgi:hypothetical protein